MNHLVPLVILAATFAGPQPAARDAFDERCQAAMAPYYAALLTSARGDSEGTLRHLVVLSARWGAVQGTAVSERPAWATRPPGSLADVIASKINSARQKTAAREMVAAHSELESIRAILRDARAHAGVRTFDDAVTDFHEAMERLTGRAGLHNEIALNNDDYAAIQEHVARAAAAWVEIEAGASRAIATGDWATLSGTTGKTLLALRSAASARDMDATQTAAERLKARYFDLLAVLARG